MLKFGGTLRAVIQRFSNMSLWGQRSKESTVCRAHLEWLSWAFLPDICASQPCSPTNSAISSYFIIWNLDFHTLPFHCFRPYSFIIPFSHIWDPNVLYRRYTQSWVPAANLQPEFCVFQGCGGFECGRVFLEGRSVYVRECGPSESEEHTSDDHHSWDLEPYLWNIFRSQAMENECHNKSSS